MARDDILRRRLWVWKNIAAIEFAVVLYFIPLTSRIIATMAVYSVIFLVIVLMLFGCIALVVEDVKNGEAIMVRLNLRERNLAILCKIVAAWFIDAFAVAFIIDMLNTFVLG